ncbi:unnamed protein product, partial [Iphiclides podalirius]
MCSDFVDTPRRHRNGPGPITLLMARCRLAGTTEQGLDLPPMGTVENGKAFHSLKHHIDDRVSDMSL